MGTRHLMCIYHVGRFIVAQYGLWDGFPGGVGVAILRFLKHPATSSVFAADPYLGNSQFLLALAETGEKGGEVEVGMDPDFATDPLFCEWTYVVDLDDGYLEAYKGDKDGLLVSWEEAGIGKGKLVGEDGVEQQVPVAKWKFGSEMEEEWTRICLAPEKKAWTEFDREQGGLEDGGQA